MQTAIKTPLTSQPLTPLTHNETQPKSKTHLKKPIISSKWGKKRSGSQRSTKVILNSLASLTSNLNILPEPFDSLAKEFLVLSGNNGGNGGKIWPNKGFGGGGNGDGRNRRKRQKLGFWIPLMSSSGLALWVVLGRENSESDLGFWVFVGVCVLGVCLFLKFCRKEVQDWVLGFCCGAALMGLGLRNNESLGKWVDGFRASCPGFMVFGKKRRKGTRWI